MKNRVNWPRQLTAAQITVQFHVAGIKFHRVNVEHVKSGVSLKLRVERFKGEKCYAICLSTGEQLGFIPKNMVPLLGGQESDDSQYF